MMRGWSVRPMPMCDLVLAQPPILRGMFIRDVGQPHLKKNMMNGVTEGIIVDDITLIYMDGPCKP